MNKYRNMIPKIVVNDNIIAYNIPLELIRNTNQTCGNFIISSNISDPKYNDIFITGTLKDKNMQYTDYEAILSELGFSHNSRRITIFSGTRKSGIDLHNRRYAKENKYCLALFPANYDGLNTKNAGTECNFKMLEKCKFLIAFWDGRVNSITYNVILSAIKREIPCIIINTEGGADYDSVYCNS